MARPPRETMAEGAVLLRGFARPVEHDLIAGIEASWRKRRFVTW